MSKEKDTRPWMTIFPDYPGAFAWILPPCDESELDSGVGGCCGDLYPLENQGDMNGERLPEWLARRFCSWIDRWYELDTSDRISDCEDNPSVEELAIDNEGIELTKELKKLYGDKYRFRYSYAWRNDAWREGERDWVVV